MSLQRQRHDIEEVIIALSTKESLKIQRAINDLYGKKVQVKVIPSLYDFLTGKVRMSSILGTPLILVNHRLMPAWQELTKLFLDFVVSFIAIIMLLPLGLFLAIIVKFTSRGSIFFRQERIGRYGKPFVLIKFRSMEMSRDEIYVLHFLITSFISSGISEVKSISFLVVG